MSFHDPYAQEGFARRLARGRRGAEEAARRGDVLVVVDVLSWATGVATATARGGAVVPCMPGDEARAAARHPGATVAVHRRDVPARGRLSLSPVSLEAVSPGEVVVVGSPNGAACAGLAAAGAGAVFAGALVNARAVGAAAAVAAAALGAPVTVLACGERWPDDTERPALEDDLGAGAILLALGGLDAASPEAYAAAMQFRALADQLDDLLWECASGRELRRKGFEGDVRHAARLDALAVAPRLDAGAFWAA